MAKIKKNLMAWVLVLSMISGMVAVPAHAAEEEKPNATVTVTVEEITNANNEVVGEKTTTETTWSDSNTAGSKSESTTEGNTTTTVEGSVSTDVSGTETKEDSVVVEDNNIISSGSVVGSESTTITDTETTTTTTTGDVYSDVDSDTVQTKNEAYEGESEYSNYNQTGSTGWVEDTDSDANSTTTENIEETSGKIGEYDVTLEENLSKDVVLEMTPGGSDTEQREVYISIEEVLKAYGIEYEEGEKVDGKVVSFVYDEKGNLIGYKFTAPKTEQNQEDVTTTSTSGKKELVPAEQPTYKYVKPANYEEGTTDITDEDGNVIGTKEITAIEDEDGNVIGYRITETKVVSEKESSAETTEEDGDATPIDPVLPEKPVAPAPVTENGLTTTVTVEDLYDGDKHVGYVTITSVTDAQGNEVSWSSSSIYHTEYSKSSTIEKDPETEIETLTTVTEVYGVEYTQKFVEESEGTKTNYTFQDVSEDIYQLIETEEGTFFLYQGKMYAVSGEFSYGISQDVASGSTVDMNSFVNGADDDDLVRNSNELNGDGSGYYTDFTNSNAYNNLKYLGNGQWKLTGYGLFSDFWALEEGGNASNSNDRHRLRQYKIQDKNGNTRYVYCVELGGGIDMGANYGQTSYDVEDGNEGNAPWTGATGTIAQLRSVALNGYWGTESGLGSLEAVKDLMIRNGMSKEDAEKLTPGMALAATQVAIWEFGTDGKHGDFGDEDYNFIYKDNGVTGYAVSADDQRIIRELRNLLVRLANDSNEGVAEEIDETSISAGGFVLKENLEAPDASGNDKYLTDVTFKLDVSTSSINGDLVVKVVVVDENGEETVVGGGRLAGDNSHGLFQNFGWGKIYPDENGVYTIENVALYENVKIDLRLEGVQHLDDGIYVFNSNQSFASSETGTHQDFIGLSKLDRNVSYHVEMEFSVTDPEAVVEGNNSAWTEKTTNVVAYKKTDNYDGYMVGTLTSEWETTNTKVIGTTTETTIVEKVTKLYEEWFSKYYNEEEIPVIEDFVPFNLNHNVPRPLNNLPDEPVPLADAPQTGDAGICVAILTVMAGIGLAVMHVKSKKEEETA